jgi:signal transduction histidine kinase
MVNIDEDASQQFLDPPETGNEIGRGQTSPALLADGPPQLDPPHRAAKGNDDALHELNETLEERTQQLAAANNKLKEEMAARKEAEKELRESEDHYRVLLTQARLMQENLRYLSCQILNVQEEERKRISRELHDEVGQALTAVNVNLAMLRKSAPKKNTDLTRKLREAQTMVEQTMESVHNFSRELRPALLDDLGLIPALRSYVKRFSERTGVRINFKADAVVEKLEMNQKTVFYRVGQEALTNIAKHAQATEGSVLMRKFKGGMQLEISDNGKSFRADRHISTSSKKGGKKRLGLIGIQERVRLANGIFNMESMPGKGTHIRVWVPFRLGSVTERIRKSSKR